VTDPNWELPEEMVEALNLEHKARRVLGVGRNAPPAEIKRAYWRLARRCHPDTHPGKAFPWEWFMLVAEAYDILTKRTGPHRRYLLAQQKGYLPPSLGEDEYFKWWWARFGETS